MKTTIVMAALALMLSVPAHAQQSDDPQPVRPNGERQYRGPGGPQFRGGDRQLDRRGDYRPGQRARRGLGDDTVQPGSNQGVCPCCGGPLCDCRRQGFGRGGQRDGQGLGPGPRRGAAGYGRRGQSYDGMDRPAETPQGRWGRGGGYGRGPQGESGFGPRGRGAGGPPWDNEANGPIERGPDPD